MHIQIRAGRHSVKRLGCSLLALTVFGIAVSSAQAQPYGRGWGQDHGGGYNYRRGEHMGRNDWNNAPVVDYRQYHLRRPHRGYEWRRSNGRYVMVAVAPGVIASVLLGGH